MPQACQGEVWFADLAPDQRTRAGGRAAGARDLGRPARRRPSELAIVVPLATTARPSPVYVLLEPPEGGVRESSHAIPELVRSLWHGRLVERWDRIGAATLQTVIGQVRLLTRPPA
jgi:mRNA-degrading endonuclease toxin of MazEF toxin-antitoxin module